MTSVTFVFSIGARVKFADRPEVKATVVSQLNDGVGMRRYSVVYWCNMERREHIVYEEEIELA
jgi:hypothetical protein